MSEDQIERLIKERDEARFFLNLRNKQLEQSTAFWLRAADAALAGNPNELITRVGLARSKARLVQSKVAVT